MRQQGNVKVTLNIMFYNENCLIPKIPPIPPGPDPGPDRVFHSVAFSIFCRARAGRVFLSVAWSNFCRAPGPDRDDGDGHQC